MAEKAASEKQGELATLSVKRGRLWGRLDDLEGQRALDQETLAKLRVELDCSGTLNLAT